MKDHFCFMNTWVKSSIKRYILLSVLHFWTFSFRFAIETIRYRSFIIEELVLSLTSLTGIWPVLNPYCTLLHPSCLAFVLFCFASILSSSRPVLHPTCPESDMSRIRPAASVLSCIRLVLYPSCPASNLSCIWTVLHLNCPASELSCIWTFLHLNCPGSDLSCIRSVCHKYCKANTFKIYFHWCKGSYRKYIFYSVLTISENNIYIRTTLQ